jgi:hypothetical protein
VYGDLSPLERAFERIAIPYLWQSFGLSGSPGASCRSPFRDDRHPSFSVYADGQRWYDFATGEGGDAADFVAKALNLSREDGCRKLIELAGTGSSSVAPANLKPRPTVTTPKLDPLTDKEKAIKRRSWPAFEPPSASEIAMMASQRGLSREGVEIAAARGLLFCATWAGRRAWVVTDSTHYNAQARRMDGEIWQGIGKKAQTLPGSCAHWPVGIKEAAAYPAIGICEGGPDLLAAFHLAWCADVLGSLGVVAMFGARNHILDDALPYFAGKRVRIFAHDDKDGYDGARRWVKQLRAAGATADGYRFRGFRRSDGNKVKDLNDFVRLDYDQWESGRAAVESLFDFVPAALPNGGNPKPRNPEPLSFCQCGL